MTLYEALDRVSGFYVPGVVRHYAKMNPDPWQAAHDDLERVAGILDEATIAPVLERFIKRCADLVEQYKGLAKPQSSVSPIDAFIVGKVARVEAHISRRLKRCIRCDGKEGLKIVPLETGSIDVTLVCAACLAKGSV